jgi:hypothetical protein
MSISDVSPSRRLNDSTEKEWDAVKKDRFHDNRDPRDDAFGEWSTPASDPVNQPLHYRVGEVEAIDYISQQLGIGVKDYLLGNLHKYLHRHRFKGQTVEDLRKARWYLERLIKEEVGE